MNGLEELKERLIRLEVAVEALARQLASSADEKKWLVRIIMAGIISAILVFITKGGLNV